MRLTLDWIRVRALEGVAITISGLSERSVLIMLCYSLSNALSRHALTVANDWELLRRYCILPPSCRSTPAGHEGALRLVRRALELELV